MTWIFDDSGQNPTNPRKVRMETVATVIRLPGCPGYVEARPGSRVNLMAHGMSSIVKDQFPSRHNLALIETGLLLPPKTPQADVVRAFTDSQIVLKDPGLAANGFKALMNHANDLWREHRLRELKEAMRRTMDLTQDELLQAWDELSVERVMNC